MAFNNEFGQGSQEPMADINMTPLIDVMLVLLVIFIITAPLMNQAIPLKLPKAQASAVDGESKKIQIAIDANNQIYWQKKPVDLTTLSDHFKEISSTINPDDQPEIHLRADEASQYKTIAQVMSAAHVAGLEKIGFVTESPTAGTPSTVNQSKVTPAAQPTTPVDANTP